MSLSEMPFSSVLLSVVSLPLVVCSCPPPKGETGTDATGGATSTLTEMQSTDLVPTSGATTGSGTPCTQKCANPLVIKGSVTVLSGDPPGEYDCVAEVDGNISFFGTGWDQEQFRSLRKVSGRLVLDGFSCRPTFLHCLESVGSLVIESPGDCFDSLDGLDALSTISSTLQISDAPGLTSLSGLDNLTVGPKRVHLWRNASLASLAGLLLPPSMMEVSLVDLPKAHDLAILGPVSGIETLALSGLPMVTDLTDLTQLGAADRLEIGSCSGLPTGLDSLQSLAGLDSLSNVSTLIISGNNSLISLDGAPLLTQMNEVVVVENPILPESAFAAFIAQNANPNANACFGDLGVCVCP